MRKRVLPHTRPHPFLFDRDSERSFWRDFAQLSILPVRFGLAVIAAHEILVSLPLLLNPPDGQQASLSAIAGRSLPLLLHVIVLASTFWRGYARHQQVIAATWAILYVGNVLSVVWPSRENHSFTAPLIVAVIATYALVRLRFLTACLICWTAVGAYIAWLWGVAGMTELSIQQNVLGLLVYNLIGMAICYQLESSARRAYVFKTNLAEERARSEALLLNILPASIAARLKEGETTISDRKDDVTVLFADIVGFTPMAASASPERVVEVLNEAFTAFDHLMRENGLEKIKTIGDAYMAVAGLPERSDDQAAHAVRAGLQMITALEEVNARMGSALKIRVGIHSGAVVAGVIGEWKFSYDLWGDTVNVASRVESSSKPGEVWATEATANLAQQSFTFAEFEEVEMKGLGPVRVAKVTGSLV
ncbi:MAG: hypothetical protein JSS66_16560 [Armatimonadetes bacterium]|nr:hypothetical protein [Armatimonadota bacterium]